MNRFSEKFPTDEDISKAEEIIEIAGRLPEQEQERLYMFAKSLERFGNQASAGVPRIAAQ